MKRILKYIIALVVLLLIAAVAAPFLIPAERYKQEIISQVQRATGRTLTIGGAMKLRLLPSLSISIENAALSNPPGFSTPQMLTVKTLNAEVALLPLLHSQVEVKRFTLDEPVVYLEANAQGARNWEFTPGKPAPLPAASGLLIGEANADEHTKASNLSALAALRLSALKIEGGTVDYRDIPAHVHYALSGLDITAAMPSPSAPMTFEGKAQWNEVPVTVSLTLDNLSTLLAGKQAVVSFDLKSAPLQAAFKGKAALDSATGTVVIGTPSVPKLAAWAGKPMAWGAGKPPLALAASGNLTCGQTRCVLNNADLALDALKAKGAVAAGWGGKVPSLQAALTTNMLDVNPYMASSSAQLDLSFISDAQAAPHPASSGWSTEPIDLSALRTVNAEVALEAPGIRVQQFELEKTSIKATLSGGVLTLNIPKTALYEGEGSATLGIDARTANPAFDYSVSASGIDAGKLLAAAANFDRLSGTASLEAKGTAHGASQQALIDNLNGSGHLQIAKGAVRGLNLAQAASAITSVLNVNALSAAQETVFSLLSGSFTITQGILKNNDLVLTGPSVQAKGAGTVDLPQQRLSYRIVPSISTGLAPAKTADNKTPAKQPQALSVPLIIEGPFAALSIRPEVNAATIQQNIGAVKDQAKNIRDNLKDIKKNPDAIKGLLNGLR